MTKITYRKTPEVFNFDNPVQTQCSSGYGNLHHTELRSSSTHYGVEL